MLVIFLTGFRSLSTPQDFSVKITVSQKEGIGLDWSGSDLDWV